MTSPAQNRVSPFSAVIAAPQRGIYMGNRGCLHDDDGAIVRSWQVRRWITCRAEFRNRVVPQWVPGRYTPLFFLDEAVAFAAGHRPCAECRRADYRRFGDHWATATGDDRSGADTIDERLHRDRLTEPRDRGTRQQHRQRHHERQWPSLPVGAFVRIDDEAFVVLDDRLVRWSTEGYLDHLRRPQTGSVTVLTPAVIVEVLLAGYDVDLHPSLCR